MAAINYSNSVVTSTVVTWSSTPPLLKAKQFSVPSDVVDNSANASQSPVSWTRGLVRASFATPQQVPSFVQARLGLYLLPLLDGANLMTPPGPTGTLPPPAGTKVHEIGLRNSLNQDSDTYSYIDIGDLEHGIHLGPFKYAIQIWNGSNFDWTVAPTLTLYRWNLLSA